MKALVENHKSSYRDLASLGLCGPRRLALRMLLTKAGKGECLPRLGALSSQKHKRTFYFGDPTLSGKLSHRSKWAVKVQQKEMLVWGWGGRGATQVLSFIPLFFLSTNRHGLARAGPQANPAFWTSPPLLFHPLIIHWFFFLLIINLKVCGKWWCSLSVKGTYQAVSLATWVWRHWGGGKEKGFQFYSSSSRNAA